MLIDHTFFVGKLALPMNAVSFSDTATSGVALALQTVGQNNIENFADYYEWEFLRTLLSPSLAEAFIKGLSEATIDPIWIALRDKLVFKIGRLNISPIANYVYCWIKRNARTKTTIAGEVDLNFTDGLNTDSSDKEIVAWNEMVQMNEEFLVWFANNHEDYKDHLDYHWFDDQFFYWGFLEIGIIPLGKRVKLSRNIEGLLTRNNSFF